MICKIIHSWQVGKIGEMNKKKKREGTLLFFSIKYDQLYFTYVSSLRSTLTLLNVKFNFLAFI